MQPEPSPQAGSQTQCGSKEREVSIWVCSSAHYGSPSDNWTPLSGPPLALGDTNSSLSACLPAAHRAVVELKEACPHHSEKAKCSADGIPLSTHCGDKRPEAIAGGQPKGGE